MRQIGIRNAKTLCGKDLWHEADIGKAGCITKAKFALLVALGKEAFAGFKPVAQPACEPRVFGGFV